MNDRGHAEHGSEFIGAIPKNIFTQEGKHHIKGQFGEYECYIKKGHIDITSEDQRARVHAWVTEDNFLFLAVVNRKVSRNNESGRNPEILIKRLILEAIVPLFIAQGYSLRGMKSDWEYWSINSEQYWAARKNGAKKAEAARSTWTYRNICEPLGFTRIRSIREIPEEQRAQVVFLKAI